mmetsp:Transcript_11240/g.26117  ORF Transcript_11240/g.26117 Transcript_11240/m.26117 type:complete len:214 (-) Transcript_11240:166-807(-)
MHPFLHQRHYRIPQQMGVRLRWIVRLWLHRSRKKRNPAVPAKGLDRHYHRRPCRQGLAHDELCGRCLDRFRWTDCRSRRSKPVAGHRHRRRRYRRGILHQFWGGTHVLQHPHECRGIGDQHGHCLLRGEPGRIRVEPPRAEPRNEIDLGRSVARALDLGDQCKRNDRSTDCVLCVCRIYYLFCSNYSLRTPIVIRNQRNNREPPCLGWTVNVR